MLDSRIFIPCINDPSKMQVNANSKESLEIKFEKFQIIPEDRGKIIKLFDKNKMNETEIKEKCIEIKPYMATLFDVWSNSAMKRFSLTSVGIAIGHANIKRLIGEFTDLSIWIN